ncbi:MAG: 30S ribosomal protein S16 [Planctomycetes bacterium]|nr:30S ribosomal protein S16 [Planctomycetota bacterium]MBL7041564.1 30S ribosomal protein S16 [Pirellulaceae bacterium]
MAVRIRLKKLGRRHRPFFRVCVMDGRVPRDGRVIEEVGYYDPMVKETDARAVLNGERIDYWLGVGAQPTEKVNVLIKKYGTEGTHLEKQRQAMERLKLSKPTAPPPLAVPKPKKQEEAQVEEAAAEEKAEEEQEAAAEVEATSETEAAEEGGD